jgi:carboxymethylenebutenolidase
MTTHVTMASKAGGQLGGEQAEPGGSGNVGGVVVVQEWHGITDQIKAKVERFAREGYLSIAPDLYHGKLAKNDEQAGKLMGELDFPRAVTEIGDAVAHLRAHPRCNGKVAVLGFCMGGALSFLAALNVEGIACAVPFYGLPPIPPEKFAHVKTPIQAHFAKRDDWAKASTAEQVKSAVNSGGGHMELFVYDAGHAFMRDGDPSKFDEAASKAAWPRAFEFLKKHLA